MTNDTLDRAGGERVRDRLPGWLLLWFIASFAGAMAFVARIVWEETILTWRQGPQMVGFTLTHAELPLFFFFLGSLLSYFVMLLFLTVRNIHSMYRKRYVPPGRWAWLLGSAICVSILFVPYTMWQRLNVAHLARTRHAPEFLTYAAATGDLGTVKAFINNGVSINATNQDGSTALHGAAVEGQMDVIKYLLAHGADPNVRNKFGTTALGDAREMKHPEAARYLETHGAR